MKHNTATYWHARLRQLQYSVHHCKPHEISDYRTAIRYANKKLLTLQRRAGIHINSY